MRLCAPKTALVLLLLSTALAAQESAADRIIKEERENGQVMELLDHLVNKIGPRLNGSDRCTKACEWSRDTLAGFGLKDARLDQWGTSPVAFNRGPSFGRMLEPEELDLNCATMAWTAGTDGVVEGRAVILPKDADAAAELGDKLKGAWVVVVGKPSEALLARCEALGCAGFVRNAGKDLIMCSGDPNAAPKRLSIYVGKTHYAKILDHLNAGKEVKLAFEMKNEFKPGPVPLYNVIADLPGSEKPDEVVIVGGHIDSWDLGTGTCDNGTGVATTLEAARLLTKTGAKPRRTIRFMLWGGEEQGLLGSQAYVRANREAMKKVSCVLDHDGGTNYVSGITGTRQMAPLFEKIFAPVKDLDPDMPFAVNAVKEMSLSFGGGGSDHMSFLAAGVPAFFWNQAGRANYGYTWHTKHDVYSAAVPEYQRHSAVVIAIAALGIADLDDLLPREGIGAARGPRRMLGIQLDDDLTITSISEGGAADKAGFKEGDRIVRIGDKAVSDVESLRAAVRDAKKETTITILRDGKETTLKVTFKE